MTATKNIGIYCPRVFCVGSGNNQSYSREYDWERLSSIPWGGEGKNSPIQGN